MTLESLELIGPHLDAANVDLKGMSDKFYREICNARLGSGFGEYNFSG